MTFSPTNDIVTLCVQGMALEETGQLEEAREHFVRAWNEATDNHERLLAAYHVSRRQDHVVDQLKWLEVALELVLQVDDASVGAARAFLYGKIAECHEDLNDLASAQGCRDLAASIENEPRDRGPFFHGTRAALRVGDLLTAGHESNYESGLIMNHIYFTALADGAGLAAALSWGEGPERVYVVEPTGSFEHDPNVTNKRFPGNPTRSYRTSQPLKIVGSLPDWERPAAETVRRLRERRAKSHGSIIN